LPANVQALAEAVDAHLSAQLRRLPSLPDELAYEVSAANLLSVCRTLRDAADLKFEQLMDVAGVDYLVYGHDEWQTHTATRSGFSRGRVARHGLESDSSEAGEGGFGEGFETGAAGAATASPDVGESSGFPTGSGHARFAVAYQLLSVTNNARLRLIGICEDDEGGEPAIDSLVDVWASANWFEREAFDLFGILFRGHPDLRRILTDYGFIGHPFRKDFPLIGNVEARYDEEKKRVVYQPVSIEPRVLVPKVIRQDHRYDAALKDPNAPR
jgi:NADH-quinone oxidoreductase subunit C